MIKFSQILESNNSLNFLRYETSHHVSLINDIRFSFVKETTKIEDDKWKRSNNYECDVEYIDFKCEDGDIVYLLICENDLDELDFFTFHNSYDAVQKLLNIWKNVINRKFDYNMKIFEHKVDKESHKIRNLFFSEDYIIHANFDYDNNIKEININNALCKDERIKNLLKSDKTLTKFNL